VRKGEFVYVEGDEVKDQLTIELTRVELSKIVSNDYEPEVVRITRWHDGSGKYETFDLSITLSSGLDDFVVAASLNRSQWGKLRDDINSMLDSFPESLT